MYEGFDRDLAAALSSGREYALATFCKDVAARTGYTVPEVYAAANVIRRQWREYGQPDYTLANRRH